MDILKQALYDIKPSKEKEKEVEAKINLFLNTINKGFNSAKAVLGGSGAKGTWLSDIHDADIFVQFDYKKYKDKSDEISDILEKHLKKKFKNVERLHGSRDYYQINDKKTGFTFEIVPVLKITKANQAMNITDVSLLHAEWVKKHKKYADEIRLMKQFCKAQKIYGAESYVKGFSGYICEILVIYYKGFMNLIRAASKWNEKEIIDAEKYYKNKNDVLFNLNKSKIMGSLVVVDPVQKDRNAAAAMSKEIYDKFIKSCREFLKHKNESFFEIKYITKEEIIKKAKGNKAIILSVMPLNGKKDVVGSKMLKVLEFLDAKMKNYGFDILETGWEWNKEALFWIITAGDILPETVIKGPPAKLAKFADDFKKKHKKTFLKNGIVYAKEEREFTDAADYVKYLIKDEYVLDKIKNIRIC